MKMRILIMMILSILGINSNAMNGPENLTIAQGNQYIVGFLVHLCMFLQTIPWNGVALRGL